VSYLKSFNDKNLYSYLGEQSINNWPGINPDLISNCLHKDFFINNNQLLLFLNKKNCNVKLHYDSGNNFHFNIWGKNDVKPPIIPLNNIPGSSVPNVLKNAKLALSCK
jgi:hypothetical protein